MTPQSPPESAPVARCSDLCVQYGSVVVLNRLTVDIPQGCVGLLGPNGAGKSTLLKTLLGFLRPTSGGAEVLGIPVSGDTRPIRQQVGLMPEQDCHIPGMSAIEFVAYAGALSGLPKNESLRRAHEVLEYCGLGEARYRQVETYSTGMKQRIKLAQALVHGPKLLFLDEPTNGLDPRGRNEMLDLIRSISKQGMVNVIVSSHLLKDIERTCDSVLVIFQGQLRAFGKIKDLLKMEGHPFRVEVKEPNQRFVDTLHANHVRVLGLENYTYQIQAEIAGHELTRRVFKSAIESSTEIRSIEPMTRSLEEAFMEALK